MSRTAATVLAVGLVAASPLAASASGLEVRLGALFPRAQSDLFSDDATLYTPHSRAKECTPTDCPPVRKSDWIGVYGGAEFSFGVAPHAELALSVDGYSRRIPTSYRAHVHSDGSEIRQTLKLTIVPVGVSLRLLGGDRHSAIAPYLTVGGDVFFYKYEEFGEFIDFFQDDLPISTDAFRSEGAIFGGHAAAGLRVPLGDDFAITGEVRYQYAPTRRMNDDFNLNRIDVSGASATIGFRLRF